jgi:hypothetical protein
MKTARDFWVWLAGFYEGEGCPTYYTSGSGYVSRRARYLRIVIVQKDPRPLRLIRNATLEFLPKVYPHTRHKKTGKTLAWEVRFSAPHSRRVALKMLPHMRHAGKIKQLRQRLKDYK